MAPDRSLDGYDLAFVDESIHPDADAIVTAIVVARRTLDEAMSEALSAHGFVPGIDEFKSSAPKASDENGRRLRDQMWSILMTEGCRVGVAINPLSERKQLASSALGLLESMVREGRLKRGAAVWFDDGLLTADARSRLSKLQSESRIAVQDESDSRRIYGLQLADLCAHTAATMLRSRMGLIRKEYPSPEGSGYGSDTMMELGFELWARLRHNLASSKRISEEGDDQGSIATLEPFGLRIADSCSSAVKEAADLAFGSVYVGCIH